MTNIVRFSNAPTVFAKAKSLFAVTVDKLRHILPYAEFQHVGSTAIPGTLTKGDLDIVVRVLPEKFCKADLQLAKLFERNTSSFQSDEFSAFQDVASDPELGVQLVVIGSEADHFHVWRHLLESDAELRCKYDELKRSFEGQSMESYREAKAWFIMTSLEG